jgi:hypothetical protein
MFKIDSNLFKDLLENDPSPKELQMTAFSTVLQSICDQKKKSVAFSQQANYTDRATAACRRIPTAVISGF